ncbi:UNVERIFIED_CONTAM: hypothetical protein GTU68_008233, partial [Idotea baltica]|nr:hypothetical protein [Idotea baltica]
NQDFSRKKRLLTASQFKIVFESPEDKFFANGLLILIRNNNSTFPRLGLVIGKKNIKLSVERNRIKRQIRESFRTNQQHLNGLDVVIIARRGLGKLNNKELIIQINKLWRRIMTQQSNKLPITNLENSYA